MAAVTSFDLTDRTPVTPVDHTFLPNGFSADRGTAFFKKSGDTPSGDMRFALTKKDTPTKKRVSARLVIPVVSTETINGIDNPKVIRAAYANVEFTFDSNSTQQERDDCIGMLASALPSAQTVVNDTIVNLNPAY